MCSHFEALRAYEDYKKYFDVLQPTPSQGKLDMWPRYIGTFISKPPETDPHDEAVPAREALLGRWGLVPWRLKPDPENIKNAMARSTFNARVERIEKNFTFGPASQRGQRGQRCIVPADAFYEPDWRTGKAVTTRFTTADGQPVGIAGLWDVWTQPGKPPLLSFSILIPPKNPYMSMKVTIAPGVAGRSSSIKIMELWVRPSVRCAHQSVRHRTDSAVVRGRLFSGSWTKLGEQRVPTKSLSSLAAFAKA